MGSSPISPSAGAFRAAPQAEVEALLGPPTEVFAGGQSYRLFKDSAGAPDKWIVYFDAGRRVRDTRRISAGYPG